MRFGLFVCLTLGVLSAAAQAQECGPLKQLNSIALEGGPNRPLIQVGINGVPKLFLLDTGGDVSQINGTVATELGLTLKQANLKLLDLYGNASNKVVVIEKFTIGQQTGSYIDLGVQPNPKFGNGTPFVGIFAPDLMGKYDVEMDFAGHRMNYFSSDHCPGHVVYWPHQALAVVPMTFRNRHITFPVQLDGKEITAEIDTGSGNTNMSAAAAKRVFGVDTDTPGNMPLNMPGMAAAYGRVFATLDFEGVAVKNPHVIIRPDLVGKNDPNNGFRTGNRAMRVDQPDHPVDLLIGMDILKRLHLHIAFDEKRLFITEGSRPDAPAKASDSAAAAASGTATPDKP